MEEFFLEEPVYSEPEQSVKLVLKNNIIMRTMRQEDRAVKNVGNDIWRHLDELEKSILVYMGSKTNVTRAELCAHTNKSNGTVSKRLNNLLDMGIIRRNGNKYDSNHTYSLIAIGE